MATFICTEFPTMTVHLPSLGRDIQLAHGEYTAANEKEAKALREVITQGYFPAYEEDREAADARAVLAKRGRAAVLRAEEEAARRDPTLPAIAEEFRSSQIERDDRDPETGVSTVVLP